MDHVNNDSRFIDLDCVLSTILSEPGQLGAAEMMCLWPVVDAVCLWPVLDLLLCVWKCDLQNIFVNCVWSAAISLQLVCHYIRLSRVWGQSVGCDFVAAHVSLYKVVTFVCLFDTVRQSVLTTLVSGLHGPLGPVSTLVGDWGLLFIRTDQEKFYSWYIRVVVYVCMCACVCMCLYTRERIVGYIRVCIWPTVLHMLVTHG